MNWTTSGDPHALLRKQLSDRLPHAPAIIIDSIFAGIAACIADDLFAASVTDGTLSLEPTQRFLDAVECAASIVETNSVN